MVNGCWTECPPSDYSHLHTLHLNAPGIGGFVQGSVSRKLKSYRSEVVNVLQYIVSNFLYYMIVWIKNSVAVFFQFL